MMTFGNVRVVVPLMMAGAALGACASCAGEGDGPLQAVDTAGAGVLVENLQKEPTWAFSGMTACVRDVPPDFKVTKLDLVEPSGDVTVDGGLYFGDEPEAVVKPGRLPGSYASLKMFDGRRVQTTPCSTDKVRALAVGVEVTSRGHWEAKGVSMTYIAGGKTYELRWGLNIRVCAIGPDDAKECQGRPAA